MAERMTEGLRIGPRISTTGIALNLTEIKTDNGIALILWPFAVNIRAYKILVTVGE